MVILLLTIITIIITLCPINITVSVAERTTVKLDFFFFTYTPKKSKQRKREAFTYTDAITLLKTIVKGSTVHLDLNTKITFNDITFNQYRLIPRFIILNSFIAIISTYAKKLTISDVDAEDKSTKIIISISFLSYRLFIFLLNVAYYKIKSIFRRRTNARK